MRISANAFKGRTALNINDNSIHVGGRNDLMVIPDLVLSILKCKFLIMVYVFKNENVTLLKTYINVIKESETL